MKQQLLILAGMVLVLGCELEFKDKNSSSEENSVEVSSKVIGDELESEIVFEGVFPTIGDKVYRELKGKIKKNSDYQISNEIPITTHELMNEFLLTLQESGGETLKDVIGARIKGVDAIENSEALNFTKNDDEQLEITILNLKNYVHARSMVLLLDREKEKSLELTLNFRKFPNLKITHIDGSDNKIILNKYKQIKTSEHIYHAVRYLKVENQSTSPVSLRLQTTNDGFQFEKHIDKATVQVNQCNHSVSHTTEKSTGGKLYVLPLNKSHKEGIEKLLNFKDESLISVDLAVGETLFLGVYTINENIGNSLRLGHNYTFTRRYKVAERCQNVCSGKHKYQDSVLKDVYGGELGAKFYMSLPELIDYSFLNENEMVEPLKYKVKYQLIKQQGMNLKDTPGFPHPTRVMVEKYGCVKSPPDPCDKPSSPMCPR